jgi:uncharacterized membrane protein YjjB (DUF3815 family)
MNTDLATSVAGAVAAICGILAYFNVIVPQPVSAAIGAVAVGVLGYFTNKASKPKPPPQP